MKLCKDCKFAVNDHPGYTSSVPRLQEYAWRCLHPSATRPAGAPSPVDGYVEPAVQMTCAEARGYGMTANCGPDGRFWEAKEPSETTTTYSLSLSGSIGFGAAIEDGNERDAPEWETCWCGGPASKSAKAACSAGASYADCGEWGQQCARTCTRWWPSGRAGTSAHRIRIGAAGRAASTSISSAIGYPGRTKSFTDLLGPLRRFLIGQVGRPWNKVYAELRERISPASTVQIHILGHVETMVARHVNRTFGRTLIGRARRYPRG
jgi:hypothetical protein